MRFYTERIGLLWSAEGMGCVLMAVAGKFNWECVRNLEAALYLCMVSPDREAMAETRKANADAVAAKRQTHNWLWRVFH
jgi:hypothetical protein